MSANWRKQAIPIGAALIISQLIMAGACYLLWMQANPGAPLGRPFIDAALLNQPLFATLSIAGIVALFVGTHVAYSQQLRHMRPMQRFVISYALRELCGVCGFVLAQLYDSPHICIPFIFAAVLAMVRGLSVRYAE